MQDPFFFLLIKATFDWPLCEKSNSSLQKISNLTTSKYLVAQKGLNALAK